jgi:hypothetical protein
MAGAHLFPSYDSFLAGAGGMFRYLHEPGARSDGLCTANIDEELCAPLGIEWHQQDTFVKSVRWLPQGGEVSVRRLGTLKTEVFLDERAEISVELRLFCASSTASAFERHTLEHLELRADWCPENGVESWRIAAASENSSLFGLPKNGAQ